MIELVPVFVSIGGAETLDTQMMHRQLGQLARSSRRGELFLLKIIKEIRMQGSKKSLSLISFSLIFLLILVGCSATSQAEPVASLLGALDGVADQVTGNQAVPGLAPATPPRLIAAANGTLAQIYQEVNPSVVHIQVVKNETALPFSHPEVPEAPNLPETPDVPIPGEPPQAFGEGSGFVWDKKGHIVTNNHVIEGAEKITVVLADDTSVAAELVGADRDSDLAVLLVDVPAAQLEPVRLGDSTTLQVGELAIAIGNPFGQEGTMTVGIISALGRLLPVGESGFFAPRYNIPDIIQTDAAINPGNSGGVLLNDRGEVIGVTTAIISAVRASSGIGFAVPAAIVQQVVPALISDGEYAHPFMGISGGSLSAEIAEAMDLPEGQRGVLVADVVPDSPADQAGLLGNDDEVEIDGFPVGIGGDVIIAIEGQPLAAMDDLIAYLESSTRAGQNVELTLLRDGRQENISLKLVPRPQRPVEPLISQETPADEGADDSAKSAGVRLGVLVASLTPGMAEAMNLPEGQEGVIIQQVEPDSPAADAGLLGGQEPLSVEGAEVMIGGDIVTAIDGVPVTNPQELADALSDYEPGDEITINLLRNGEGKSLEVILGESEAK